MHIRDWATRQTSRLLRSWAPAACVAATLGLTTAVLVVGLTTRIAGVFVTPLSAPRTVLAASFLALSAGLAIPRGFVTWLCVRAWKQFVEGSRSSDFARALVGRSLPDRALYWTVLSVVALAAGIATALTPISLRTSMEIYRSLHVHFVWSDGPLEVLHLGLSATAGLLPLALLGLALACVHHLSSSTGRWDTTATGWWLAGAAVGAWLALRLASRRPLADAAFLACSLPPFLVAVTAAALSSQFASEVAATERDQSCDLPLWSDRWPRLLRASIVAVGSAGASAAAIWTTSSRLSSAAGPKLPAAILTAMGLGVLLACHTRRGRVRSIGGFGVAAAAAGIVTAVSGMSAGHSTFGGGVLRPLACCLSVGSIAYATAYGRKTLLDRVASRSSAGTKIMARLLTFAGLSIWVAVPLAMRFAGPRATLVLLALLLLALGGLLIIHEPGYSTATRRARIALVFGAVGTMIVVSSLPSDPWRRAGPTSRPSFSGSAEEPVTETAATTGPVRMADRR